MFVHRTGCKRKFWNDKGVVLLYRTEKRNFDWHCDTEGTVHCYTTSTEDPIQSCPLYRRRVERESYEHTPETRRYILQTGRTSCLRIFSRTPIWYFSYCIRDSSRSTDQGLINSEGSGPWSVYSLLRKHWGRGRRHWRTLSDSPLVGRLGSESVGRLVLHNIISIVIIFIY